MFGSIVVPIDLTAPSSWRYALPKAIELAAPGNGKVAVVAVLPELRLLFESVEATAELDRVAERARRQLAEIVAAADHGAADVQQELRSGSITHEIIGAAKARGADLIVMTSRRPEMRDYPIGANAAQVVRHAPCSVLVLR